MRTDRVTAVARDVLCLVVGFGGITYQQVTGRVSWELLLTYSAMIGGAVWANLRTLQTRAAEAAEAASSTVARTSGPSSLSGPPGSPQVSSQPPSAPLSGGEV